jgi:endonuclease/exonuclease/phosphatase family metal-dependent hydrolase
MKLISLNTGMKLDNIKNIIDFLKDQNADILALQEVTRHLEDTVHTQYQKEKKLTDELKYAYKFYAPLWIANAIKKNGEITRDFGGDIEQGNEIFSKYKLTEATNELFYNHYSYMFDWTNWYTQDHARAIQIVELEIQPGKNLQVLNLHGIWTQDKHGDDRTRKECEYIVKAAKRKNIPTIIAGDFNLLPNTESIAILNKEFRNLTLEFNIQNTRPDFKDTLETGNNAIDYIFVSEDVKVRDCNVPQVEVSDHLPLMLEFEI